MIKVNVQTVLEIKAYFGIVEAKIELAIRVKIGFGYSGRTLDWGQKLEQIWAEM